MQKTWVIADTHFGHKNIIDYCYRPFETVEQMDETLISNWNSVVKNDKQLVYMLGDFAMYPPSKVSDIISRLNGKKHLIMGNHDKHKSVGWWRNAGFDEVSKFPIIINNLVILSHEPMFINEHTPFVNIFGHVHDNTAYKDYSSQGFCASVERINYTPIDYNCVINKIKGCKGDLNVYE